MSESSSRSLAGYWLAPVLIGLGYALARNVVAGRAWTGLYAQSPFALAFFSGLLIAFALRPVILRVPWSRGVAMGVAAGVLLGMGTVPDWCLARLAAALGAAPFPHLLPPTILPELVALPVAAVLMGLLFRPPETRITPADLRARLGIRSPAAWLWRFTALAAGAVLLWLLIGWADGLTAGSRGIASQPLAPLNPWAQLTGQGMQVGDPTSNGAGQPIGAGWVRGAGLLLLYWLRALAMLLPLLPIALVVRARWVQITLVFSLLLFIVGDFAPLMMEQPYPSTPWLLARTGLGALQAVLLGGAAAFLIGQLITKGE